MYRQANTFTSDKVTVLRELNDEDKRNYASAVNAISSTYAKKKEGAAGSAKVSIAQLLFEIKKLGHTSTVHMLTNLATSRLYFYIYSVQPPKILHRI